jgi:asparagine synthase (glutamine-hydrolysing)
MLEEDKMSSQAGLFNFDRRPIQASEADAIIDSLAMPDYVRPVSWTAPGVLLAQADFPSAEHAAVSTPPYTTSIGTITFDGRLDNREELRLVLCDQLRDGTSDLALALAAYERRGGAGLATLIGDWSLVIWDRSQECLILASDFAGVRPLYYWNSGRCIWWSTRLKPLVQWAKANEIDDEYVAGYLLYGGCPNRTPFRGIFSLPPGHCLTASGRGVEIRPFWQMPVGNIVRYQRGCDYEERLRELFRDAVCSRLRTDAPALLELSGGLDSSSVVCMASELVKSGAAKAPQIITLTYERSNSLDTRFYRAVEEWCRNESLYLSTSDHAFITDTHVGDSFPAFWEDLDKAVASAARERGARVLLTGSLGDLVMGNSWDDSDQVLGLLRVGRIRDALSQTIAWSKALRVPMISIWWRLFSYAMLASAAGPAWQRSIHRDGVLEDDSIAPSFRSRLGLCEPHRFFSSLWTEAPIERRELFRSLAETLELRKLQPSEPLILLSYTHPYAHRPLLSFVLSIPPEIVCGPGERRRLMRRAFSPFWPPALRTRRSKDSFAGVFYDALRPIARKLLSDVERLQVVERGYIDPYYLRLRLERLVDSLECNQPQLRLIIALELWLRRIRLGDSRVGP